MAPPSKGGRGGRGGRGAAGRDATAALHAYFERVYGATRWRQQLLPALVQETSHVALLNAYAVTDVAALAQQEGLQPLALGDPSSGRCFRRAQDCGPYAPPGTDAATGLRTHFWMDAASLVPPLLLEPRPGHRVLDMCAAPGGKTLVLAMQLFPPTNTATSAAHPSLDPCTTVLPTSSSSGPPNPAPITTAAAGAGTGAPGRMAGPTTLVANEADRARCGRLQGVLAEHLPGTLRAGTELQQLVRVTSHCADKYWQRHEAEQYNRVLLDAPCSSDRHVLQRAQQAPRGGVVVGEWSEASCRRLADLQLQLLLAGLRALAVGGRLVYSTCSMAPLENDDVVDRALARMPPGAIATVPLLTGASMASTAQKGATPASAMLEAKGGSKGPAQPAQEADPAPSRPAALPAEVLRDVFGAEPTRHGVLILPDGAARAGPMYVAVLHKRAGGVQDAMAAAARLGFQLLAPASGSEDSGDEDSEEQEGEGDKGLDGGEQAAGVGLDRGLEQTVQDLAVDSRT